MTKLDKKIIIDPRTRIKLGIIKEQKSSDSDIKPTLNSSKIVLNEINRINSEIFDPSVELATMDLRVANKALNYTHRDKVFGNIIEQEIKLKTVKSRKSTSTVWLQNQELKPSFDLLPDKRKPKPFNPIVPEYELLGPTESIFLEFE